MTDGEKEAVHLLSVKLDADDLAMFDAKRGPGETRSDALRRLIRHGSGALPEDITRGLEQLRAPSESVESTMRRLVLQTLKARALVDQPIAKPCAYLSFEVDSRGVPVGAAVVDGPSGVLLHRDTVAVHEGESIENANGSPVHGRFVHAPSEVSKKAAMLGAQFLAALESPEGAATAVGRVMMEAAALAVGAHALGPKAFRSIYEGEMYRALEAATEAVGMGESTLYINAKARIRTWAMSQAISRREASPPENVTDAQALDEGLCAVKDFEARVMATTGASTEHLAALERGERERRPRLMPTAKK